MEENKIGELIKKLRNESKLTQKEFAKKYNVSFQAVSKWENGQNIPDISLLKKICNDYNLSIDEILNGEKKNKYNKNKKLYIIFTIILFIIAIILLIILLNPSKFEFKTIKTTCNDFKITGTLAYSKNESHLYLSNIDYCGDNDEEIYSEITCSLIEKNNDIEKNITNCDIKNNKAITLKDYLENVEFNLDNFSNNCKNYTNDSLYLKINAKDKNNKTINYTIPLSLNSCKN